MRSLVLGLLSLAAAAHAAGATPSADQARIGRLVYQQNCAACHGAKGEGAANWQKPDAQGELPAPAHDSTGHSWKHGDGMLYRIVREGWRDPFNKTQRLTMPAFKDALSPGKTRAVIDYLKTLWTPEQRRFQREESRQHPFPNETQ